MKSVCYFMTRNLYRRVIPSIKSVLFHHPDAQIYLFIEDDDIEHYVPANVKCVNVSDQKFFLRSSPNWNNPWTYMSMMRVAVCHLLPDLDRILYLDVDTIVDGDIGELFEMDLKDNYFAGVEETYRKFPMQHYYNAGVLVFNLEKMRDGKADEIIRRLNRQGMKFVEQDCLNLHCEGKILPLPSKFNVCRMSDPTDEKLIHHFAGKHAWFENEPVVKKYKNMEWSMIHESV